VRKKGRKQEKAFWQGDIKPEDLSCSAKEEKWTDNRRGGPSHGGERGRGMGLEKKGG